MRIDLEPIGIIKKSGKNSEILIYSEFEQVVKSLVSKLGKTSLKGKDVLVVHKSRNTDDVHQVEISRAKVIGRVGNILKIGKINANDDSVIDIRPDVSESIAIANE
ncbi:tRNA (Thr-GGU) A37 N-methylase [Methanohalophilus levihalophilus]|uniref:hypothetical protein n=1 Tax=Methanohalophilus levihalophilus TaxID=1431282 RepID=UPI001AE5622C|nr:hypothetical protein [Methanohalophilus levihalophilus]MBP2030649.1 tRNA (Thr-GGU) A37 N-methylase [Methanohalophilus levihalophilus]